MTQYKVASLAELTPGTGKVVVVNEKPIALFNVNGKIYATDNTCPHRGGSLGEGMLNDTVVTCPWHGWQFDVATGNSPLIPGVKIQTLKVTMQGDDIYVEC